MRSSVEIRAEIVQLQIDKDAITEQVDFAKRNAAATKVYADPDWLRRAEHAAKAKGREIGRLQLELSAALKEERAANPTQEDGFAARFVSIAKAVLPDDLYEKIRIASQETLQQQG